MDDFFIKNVNSIKRILFDKVAECRCLREKKVNVFYDDRCVISSALNRFASALLVSLPPLILNHRSFYKVAY